MVTSVAEGVTGGGVVVTVSVAALLVTLPVEFVTTTENVAEEQCPAGLQGRRHATAGSAASTRQ